MDPPKLKRIVWGKKLMKPFGPPVNVAWVAWEILSIRCVPNVGITNAIWNPQEIASMKVLP